jgi:hypothetical protein
VAGLNDQPEERGQQSHVNSSARGICSTTKRAGELPVPSIRRMPTTKRWPLRATILRARAENRA